MADLPAGRGEIHALAGMSLTVRSGEMVASSGDPVQENHLPQSGGLPRPAQPRQLAGAGHRGDRAAGEELVAFRRDRIGFIFQLFYLIPTLTVRRTSSCRSSSPGGATRSAWRR